MNINADNADAAPADFAADEDEDSDSFALSINPADEMYMVLGYIGFDCVIVCN